MIEVTGNLWDYPADAVVVTTNGTVKKNGEAVMGRGCALEAAQKEPYLKNALGFRLRQNGNHVYSFAFVDRTCLFTFPVKRDWQEAADLKLIEQSCIELLSLVNNHHILSGMESVVVMPRPGCGNGRLDWNEVRQICSLYLDRRFHVITFETLCNKCGVPESRWREVNCFDGYDHEEEGH